MDFYINQEYLTNVIITKTYYSTQRPDELSDDYLIRRLKEDSVLYNITSSIDHPEFTLIRNKLNDLGYIDIMIGVCNGDKVLKQFYLNTVKFLPGEKFYCAYAMKHHLEYRLKHGTYTP